MNYELFWIIRQGISKLKFNFNKILFDANQLFYRVRTLSSFSALVTKMLLSQIMTTLIFASILYLTDFALSSLITNITSDNNFAISLLAKSITLDNNALSNIIIGGMGVAGVIIGLYCSNMASIYSSKYTNAPNSLAVMFQKDVITNKCVKQIVSYIILCLILLFEYVIKIELYYISALVFFILTIRMIITFSITGNRTYQLSDTYKIADTIYPEMYSIIREVSNQKYFSQDRNFQNHFQIISYNWLKILEDISTYNRDNPQNQNATMLTFMSKNLMLIHNYWNIKTTIYYESLWFRNKRQYPQWHRASDTEIDLALRSGTTLKLTEIKDYLWFENRLEQINDISFNKLCKDRDFQSIYSYLAKIADLSTETIKGDALLHWVKYIESLQNKVLEVCVETYQNNKKQDDAITALVDIFSYIYLSLIVGINQYLLTFDNDDYLGNAKHIYSYKHVDFRINRFLNNRNVEKMYHCIEAEFSIEGKRITPDWYIEQTVCNVIYNHFNSIIETMDILYNNLFTMASYLIKSDLYVEAMIVFARFPELDAKSNLMLNFFDKRIKQIEAKHFEKSIIWEECKLQEFKNNKAEIAKRIPEQWIKCSGRFALENWTKREDSPDLLGFCYNYLCEHLISAMEHNDFTGFKIGYSNFGELMLLYQEYVRTDMIKVKELHLQVTAFNIATAPIIEYAIISGLAILWGEFVQNKQWHTIVEDTLREFIDSDREKNSNILVQLTELAKKRKKCILGIGNRDLLQTGWELRIAKAVRDSNLYQFEYSKYGTQKMITNSQLLKIFCGSTFDLGFSNTEDIFFLVCVNQYLPEENKYKGDFQWEGNLYESEQ